MVFGKEQKGGSVEYANCMVCSRQHHLDCVGQDTFICAACQKRTLGKTIGAGNSVFQQLAIGSGVNVREGVAGAGGVGASPAMGTGLGASPSLGQGSTRSSRRSAIPPIVHTY